MFDTMTGPEASMDLELEERTGSPSVADQEPLLPRVDSRRKVEIGSCPLTCLLLQHLSRWAHSSINLSNTEQ